MARHQDLPVILHNDKRGLLTIEHATLDVLQLSNDGRPPKRLLTCALGNFLKAHLAAEKQPGQNRRLDLHCLSGRGTNVKLSKLHVLVEPINVPEAEEWVQTIMAAAYGAIKPFRRVLLLVNPVGGKGKAKSIVSGTALPILEAAGVIVDVKETTHRLHAEEIANSMDLVYDVIATSSGDGLIYEVINGLASRSDARKALLTPIAPIPTGSACAVSINLMGVKDTFNIPLACLNIIKGRSMPIDLCSVLMLPSNTRRFSFLSQAIGLMVDLDIGTENLRWMGDTRFVVGFLKGITQNKGNSCRVKLKVVEDDKVEMASKARDRVRDRKGDKVVGGGVDPLVEGMRRAGISGSPTAPNGTSRSGPPSPTTSPLPANGAPPKPEHTPGDDYVPDHGPIPPSKPLEPDDSWLVIESSSAKQSLKKMRSSQTLSNQVSAVKRGGWIDGEKILWVYSGMMPWAARDFMQWPVAISGDGTIDVVIQSVVPRMMLVNAIAGAEKGDVYWMDCQHYYKVSSFIVENLDKANQPIFTIDGESFPFDSFHVDVHPRAANLLSLDGDFYTSEFLQKHDVKK
ncbi:hypothetical protein IAT38_005103 [Cryptococcus sp. DSM 104549]